MPAAVAGKWSFPDAQDVVEVVIAREEGYDSIWDDVAEGGYGVAEIDYLVNMLFICKRWPYVKSDTIFSDLRVS